MVLIMRCVRSFYRVLGSLSLNVFYRARDTGRSCPRAALEVRILDHFLNEGQNYVRPFNCRLTYLSKMFRLRVLLRSFLMNRENVPYGPRLVAWPSYVNLRGE